MNLKLDQHIIPGIPNIVNRFDNNLDIIDKIFLIERRFETIIWNKMIKNKIIEPYFLCKEKFLKFESIDFTNNYSLVSNKFKLMRENSSRVLLIWNAEFNPIVTDIDTFIDNWEEFYCPSSDDLYVISESCNWIAYLAHYESLLFGEGIK